MKLELWHAKLEKNFVLFPQLNTFIDGNELNVNDNMLEVMKQHISILNEEISHYFPDLQEFEKSIDSSTTRLYSPLVICLQRTIRFKNSLLI